MGNVFQVRWPGDSYGIDIVAETAEQALQKHGVFFAQTAMGPAAYLGRQTIEHVNSGPCSACQLYVCKYVSPPKRYMNTLIFSSEEATLVAQRIIVDTLSPPFHTVLHGGRRICKVISQPPPADTWRFLFGMTRAIVGEEMELIHLAVPKAEEGQWNWEMRPTWPHQQEEDEAEA